MAVLLVQAGFVHGPRRTAYGYSDGGRYIHTTTRDTGYARASKVVSTGTKTWLTGQGLLEQAERSRGN